MQITVSTADLFVALTVATKNTKKENKRPEYGYVHLMADNNKLVLKTFVMDARPSKVFPMVQVETWIDADIMTNGETAVDAKQLLAIVKHAEAPQTTLRQTGDENLFVTNGKAVTTLEPLQNPFAIPIADLAEGQSLTLPAKDLLDLIKTVKNGYGPLDCSRPTLHGICIYTDGTHLCAATTDTYQMYLSKKKVALEPETPKLAFIIPAIGVPVLIQALTKNAEQVKLTFQSAEKLTVETKGTVITMTPPGNIFPHITRVLPKDNDPTRYVFFIKKELSLALKGFTALTSKNTGVQFKIKGCKDTTCSLTVVSDLGIETTKRTVECSYHVDVDITFTLNICRLAKILASMKSGQIRLHLPTEVGENVEGLFTFNDDNEGSQFVLMSMSA